ncbi:hypothetical protein ACEZCY_19205 [Streptacidiphilus sp. N1-12]|uniref:Uncharacterized protein n=2 Tax=Streptacidiphilus alkalitolerans TaxID=3342712 RepID=A0ABV6WH19_9ACTN
MTTPARPPAAPATVDSVRARFDQAQSAEADTFTRAEVGALLGEIDRLNALLSGGITEYAVQAHIDDRPGTTEEYGTEREALLIRLEQHRDQRLPGYRLTVLTRRTVRTPWAETTDPDLRAALGD